MGANIDWSSVMTLIHCIVTLLLGVGIAYIYFVLLPKKVKGASQNGIEQERVPLASQEEVIGGLRKQLIRKDEIIEDYKKTVNEFIELIDLKPTFKCSTNLKNEEALEKFVYKMVEIYPADVDTQAMYAFFDRHRAGSEAYGILKQLQYYMNEVKNKLNAKEQEPPLKAEQKSENLAALLNMGMIAFDAITSFDTINARDEQDLNKLILKEIISKEEALYKAKQITDRPMETPRWIRVIKASVEGTGIKDKGIIFSGYKL